MTDAPPPSAPPPAGMPEGSGDGWPSWAWGLVSEVLTSDWVRSPATWLVVGGVLLGLAVRIAALWWRGRREDRELGAAGGPRAALVRAASPPKLPPGEEETLRRVRAVADFLDNSLRIPGLGFPIGWDAVIGLIPGFGDAATAALSVWIMAQARRLGVPASTLARMAGNVGLDLAGGSVPGVGDALDVLFRANRKNLRLIEKHLSGD